MERLVALFLEVAGIAAVVIGAFLLSVWLGFLVLGFALVVVGVALEPDGR